MTIAAICDCRNVCGSLDTDRETLYMCNQYQMSDT